MRVCYGLQLALVGILAASAGCRRADGPVVLARVGDHEITVDDLQAEAERRHAIGRSVPDKNALLEEMIAYQALLARCRTEGVSDDPVVEREVSNLLVRRLRERVLLPRLAQLDVSDDEIMTAYEARRREFERPARVRLAVLCLATQPGMSDAALREVRERLLEARRRVIANPPRGGRGPAAMGFGKLAIDFSDDQASRYRGGDIGWLEPGNFAYRWPREVLEAGYAGEKGVVSDLIEDDKGMYLVMKTDSREATALPLEQVKGRLRQELIAMKKRDAEEAFRSEALELAQVEIEEGALSGVALPEQSNEVVIDRAMEPPVLGGVR